MMKIFLVSNTIDEIKNPVPVKGARVIKSHGE